MLRAERLARSPVTSTLDFLENILRYWNAFDFWIDFLKQWLFPRLGAAVGAFLLASVIFHLPLDTEFGPDALAAFNKIFEKTKSPLYVATLIVVGVCYSATILLKPFYDGRRRRLTWTRPAARYLSPAFDFVFGLLLLPMTVALAGGWIAPDAFGGLGFAVKISFAVAAYVLIGLAVRLSAEENNHPYEAITISVRVPTGHVDRDFRHNLKTRIRDLLAYTNRTQAVEPSVEAPGYCSICVGFDLRYEAWEPSEKEALRRFFSALLLEWKNSELNVTLDSTQAMINDLTISSWSGLTFRVT